MLFFFIQRSSHKMGKYCCSPPVVLSATVPSELIECTTNLVMRYTRGIRQENEPANSFFWCVQSKMTLVGTRSVVSGLVAYPPQMAATQAANALRSAQASGITRHPALCAVQMVSTTRTIVNLGGLLVPPTRTSLLNF